MENFTGAIGNLIRELMRLPSIGPKSAQRLAYFIIDQPENSAFNLARAIIEAKKRIKKCLRCFNLSEDDYCNICKDPKRNQNQICVVSEAKDVIAIEKSRGYRGLYHVLGGLIMPIEGIGPSDLRIKELKERIDNEPIKELILATSQNIAGEATCLYIIKILQEIDIIFTKPASGLPIGSHLEYVDEFTLSRAMENRQSI